MAPGDQRSVVAAVGRLHTVHLTVVGSGSGSSAAAPKRVIVLHGNRRRAVGISHGSPISHD